MEFIAGLKLLEPGEKMRRRDWPSWAWLHITPIGLQLKFRGKAGTKLAFDTLSLQDTIENDWWLNGVHSK